MSKYNEFIKYTLLHSDVKGIFYGLYFVTIKGATHTKKFNIEKEGAKSDRAENIGLGPLRSSHVFVIHVI